MQAGCGLLANAAGSTETYSLSRPVEGNLGTFISHSWRSNALHKYLTILYHANMQRAFAIGHAAAFVAFLIGLFIRFVLRWRLLIICHWVIPGGAGFHPGGDAGAAAAWGDYANADLPHVMPMTFLSGVAMSVGMICAVFGLLGTADRTCFLDKCCIHQTDLKLKLQGIARLDEFIFHSSEMLVLYDSDYFERLWCTCEIAAYIHGAKKSNGPRLARLEPMLTVRPSSAFVTGKEKLTERRLTFLPIDIGVFAVRVCVIVAVGTFAFCLLQRALTLPALAGLIDLTNPAQYLLFYAVMANPVYWVPKMMTCYRFAVKRELLLEQLANFDCRTSKVHSESDRALVEEKIVKWFGSLDAFNREFHGEQGSLMQAVETALPNNAIAYLAILFENSPAFGYFSTTFCSVRATATRYCSRSRWASVSTLCGTRSSSLCSRKAPMPASRFKSGLAVRARSIP